MIDTIDASEPILSVWPMCAAENMTWFLVALRVTLTVSGELEGARTPNDLDDEDGESEGTTPDTYELG